MRCLQSPLLSFKVCRLESLTRDSPCELFFSGHVHQIAAIEWGNKFRFEFIRKGMKAMPTRDLRGCIDPGSGMVGCHWFWSAGKPDPSQSC